MRRSFKPAASFFEKIALGAVGAEAVKALLNDRGHLFVELENGALDTKIWKDVKRKRVRIPDLVCLRCGRRLESRAKTKPEISMSHSIDDAERDWGFGMIPEDWVAFPVCQKVVDFTWSEGRLAARTSRWREQAWAVWDVQGAVNIFSVEALRSKKWVLKERKGVTEGSETQVFWPAVFASSDRRVADVTADYILFARGQGQRPPRARLKRRDGTLLPAVSAKQECKVNQVLAATVAPVSDGQLVCRSKAPLDAQRVLAMLESPERTCRYTGCRVAKRNNVAVLEEPVKLRATETAEDLYVRLEARSYLVGTLGADAREWFEPLLDSEADDQDRLECIITLADTRGESAYGVLATTLADADQPLPLRSAAAWAMGRRSDSGASEALTAAFADVEPALRDEALAALVNLGEDAAPALVAGFKSKSGEIVAGSAEALRQIRDVPLEEIVHAAESGPAREWAVWLLGNLPRHVVEPHIAGWQDRDPELHFAMSVLWSFLDSWVARHWQPILEPPAEA